MVKSSARALWKSMSLYTMYAYEPVAWLASPSVTFGVRWEISGRSVGDQWEISGRSVGDQWEILIWRALLRRVLSPWAAQAVRRGEKARPGS